MTDNVTVTKVINQVQIASDGPQGPQGPTGATGASGVISVTAPITNTGTSTSAVIGINAGVAGGVATLDGTGKVPQGQLPAVAITNTFVVASQAAMLALTAEEGDVAVRTDLNKSFILTATPSSTLANWQELLTPTDSVLSVDGLTGAVDLTTKYAQLAITNSFASTQRMNTITNTANTGSYISLNSASNNAFILGRVTTASTLIVQAAASQAANIQEWQNSAGSVLAQITSGGNINLTSTYGSFTAPQVAIQNTSSGGSIYLDSGKGGTAGSFIFRTGSGLVNVLTITGAGTINFVTGNTSATATAGAVSLPAQAVGFITMQVAGTTVKVPYYAN